MLPAPVQDVPFGEFNKLEDLEAIKALPANTKEVCLFDVGDNAVAELDRLDELTGLAISSSMPGPRSNNRVTETRLIEYLGSSKIQRLHVSHVKMGDALLEACADLKSLRVLDVYWALLVTPEGVERFRTARPDVDFSIYMWETPPRD
jgi:hypothetical protein